MKSKTLLLPDQQAFDRRVVQRKIKKKEDCFAMPEGNDKIARKIVNAISAHISFSLPS